MKLLRPVLAVVVALATAGCAAQTPVPVETAQVSLTMSGWALSTTPEFQALVDAFRVAEPNITITIQEYDPSTYENRLLADMTANQAPDVIAIRQAKYVTQWADGGQLMDVSDLATKLPASVSGAASYLVGGKYYGIPYRQDSWLLFYDKDLFDKAGVAIPNGKWTWADYVSTAKDLTTKLAAAGIDAKATFQPSAQSSVQGFANAQKGDVANLSGPYFSGDYSYMLPYYQNALDLQTAGAQPDYSDVTTNKLTYQTQFGKQAAAMVLAPSSYIQALINGQRSGDAMQFDWGLAPVPQADSSSLKTPITFGDPTGMGINANIDSSKVQAAKDFLTFISSETAAKALASVGASPAMSSSAVAKAFFAVSGTPQDATSKVAFQTHLTYPENPAGPDQIMIAMVLGNAHTAIMTGADPQATLSDAGTKVANKDW